MCQARLSDLIQMQLFTVLLNRTRQASHQNLVQVLNLVTPGQIEQSNLVPTNVLKSQSFHLSVAATNEAKDPTWEGLIQFTYLSSTSPSLLASKWRCRRLQTSITCSQTSTRLSCKRVLSNRFSSALTCLLTSCQRVSQPYRTLWSSKSLETALKKRMLIPMSS